MGTETGSQLHTFHSSYKLMEHMEVGYELGGKKTSSWWSPQANHHQLGYSYSVFSEIHVRLCS